MASEEFLIAIILDAIDKASPTIAKVAAEVEALKRAAAGEVRIGSETGTPMGVLAKDVEAVGTAAEGTERRARSLTSSMDSFVKSSKDAEDAEGKLAKRTEELSKALDEFNASIKDNHTLSADQVADAKRLQSELASLSRAYPVLSEGARQWSIQSRAVSDILKDNELRIKAITAASGQQVDAMNRVAVAQQKSLDAYIKQSAAADTLNQRVLTLSRNYDDFVGRMQRGNITIEDATTGYKQMATALTSVSKQFDPASEAALRFAGAARIASEEAARLAMFSGGGGGGGGGILGLGAMGGGDARRLIWGTGHAPSPWTLGLPLASMGSIAALGGLGPEHLLMTGVGLLGSAAGGVLGGGLLAAGALGQTAVGAGSEAAVMKSTIADTTTLYKQLQTNQQNVALAQANVNTMVAQYGKNSQQAKDAQQQLVQTMGQASAALKYQQQQLGPAAAAETRLAEQVQKLNTAWDKQTAPARKVAVDILSQVVGLGHQFLPLVADAADRNLKIIDKGLKPLFEFLDGPGKRIFQDLENAFAKRLPASVHAFTQALELALKVIDYVSKTFDKGGFTDAVDKFFSKWNDPRNWDQVKRFVDGLVRDFKDWKDLIEILVKDIYQLFHADAGTARGIVVYLTDMLDKLHKWEMSTRGQQQLHTIFEVHKQEILALLSILAPLITEFGRFYMIVAPPLTQAFTLIFRAISDLLNGFVSLGQHLGPFKTLWNDGVLVPFAAFLVLWKTMGSASAAAEAPIKLLNNLKDAATGAFNVLKSLPGTMRLIFGGLGQLAGGGGFGGLAAAWDRIKGGFGGGSPGAATPAEEMQLAFKEGGATAADAIATAITAAGARAAEAMAAAITAGGSAGASELAIGEAAGAGVPGAASLLSGVEGGASAQILSKSGISRPPTASSVLGSVSASETAGTAATGIGLSDVLGTLGPMALAVGGGILLNQILPTDFKNFLSGTPSNLNVGPGPGLTPQQLLFGGGTSNEAQRTFGYGSSSGLASLFATSSTGQLSRGMLGGGLSVGAAGAASAQSYVARFLPTAQQLDLATATSNQLDELRKRAEALAALPDITAKQRSGLQQLVNALEPANVAITKANTTWGAAFAGISSTTGAVMPQVEQIVKTQMSTIGADFNSGTKQWQNAINANYGGAISELMRLNQEGVLSTSKMISDIGTLLAQALKALGANTHTAAGQLTAANLLANLPPGAVTIGQAQNLGIVSPGAANSPTAAGNMFDPQPRGKIIQVAEGGYPEVVLTTDPKYAPRQRQLLSQYLTAAPHILHGSYAAGGGIGGASNANFSSGNYVFPFPRGEAFTWERIDQGQDLLGPAGGPVVAIGPGSVSIGHDVFSGFGPFFPIEAMSAGPLSGQSVYYGHTRAVRTGTVKAGDIIAYTQPRANDWTAAPAGWLEIGLASALGQGIHGQGAAIAPLLHSLSGVTGIGGVNNVGSFGGIGVSGPSWSNIGMPSWTGPGGATGAIGQAVGRIVLNAANAYGQRLIGSMAGSSYSGVTASGPVERSVAQFFGAAGLSKIGIAGLLGNALQESSMNPATPGGGLWQMISTFGAGAPPLGIQMASLLSQIRGDGVFAALNQASSPAAAATLFMQMFEKPLPATENLARRIAGANAAYAAGYAGGGIIPAASGFSGMVSHPTMFLAGEAGMEHVNITPAQGGGFFSPSSIPYSQVAPYLQNLGTLSAGGAQAIAPQDIQLAINVLYTQLTHTITNLTNYMNALSKLTNQGGLLDQLSAAVQELFTQMSDKIVNMALFVNRHGLVVQRMSSSAQDEATIDAYQHEYAAMGRESQMISRAQGGVLGRISGIIGVPTSRLQGMTPLQLQQLVQRVSPRNAAAHRLAEMYGNLYGRQNSITDQRAQTLSAIYQEQGTLLSDRMTGIQDTLGTRADVLNTRMTSMQNLGTLGAGRAGSRLTDALIDNANAQITQYQKILKQAQAEGNKDMAAQAKQQIDQLKQSVSGYATQLLQAQVQYFTQQTQYEMNALQRRTSYAQNVVAKGVQGPGGAAQTLAAQLQLGVLQSTGTALQGQLASAQGFYRQAEAQGNTQLANQLLDQIGQLNEQLAENTQAISDQTVAVRQTLIDFINHATQFQTGIFGGLFSVVQTMGQLTGGLDIGTGVSLLTANQGVLQGANVGLLGQLASGFGINLTGLANNPTGLIQALGGLNYSQLEAGMTAAQQTQFEALITQITGNIGALEQNTVQLQQLNGQLSQPQSFSTSAWQMFRTAVFSGMGTLLPQFSSIPHMAGGGMITREGLAYLHPAEVVTPAGKAGGDINMENHFHQAGDIFDPRAAGRAMAWNLKTSGQT